MKKTKAKKTTKFTAKHLDELIEEATTDAYNESEQAGGFFAMIEENLSLPFTTRVLGQDVTVARIDITGRDQIVAICMREKSTQAIPILDLPIPDPPPEGKEWIEAYRRWCGN
ncbi:MAG: calcium-binding protein [Porticoccaceae bacterium]